MTPFEEATKEMRKHQKAYFSYRRPEDLRLSKTTEAKVDKLLKELEQSKTPQAKLF